MLAHPGEEGFAVSGNRIPGDVEGVIASVIAERVGGMRAAWHFRDCAHRPVGQDGGVRAGSVKIIDDFFYGDERPGSPQHCFFLHAYDTFEEDVADAVGSLRVDDGEIWPDGGHGGELFACEGAFDKADARVNSHKVGTRI